MANVEKSSASDEGGKGDGIMSDQSAEPKSRNCNIQQLRALWAEGEVSGSATAVDFDNLLDEAREAARL